MGNFISSGTASSGTALSDYTSDFSPFGFGSSGGGNALPIELLSFTGTEQNGDVLLNWQVASQINNDIFQKGLYLRRWKRGDKICSSTGNNHALISDLYINNKFSGYDKLVQPIVVDGTDKIIWIPGIAHAHLKYKLQDYKMKVLKWQEA